MQSGLSIISRLRQKPEFAVYGGITDSSREKGSVSDYLTDIPIGVVIQRYLRVYKKELNRSLNGSI